MDERTALLARIRELQASRGAGATASKSLRIILEFDRQRDPDEVAREIRGALNLSTTAAPLSEAHGEGASGQNDGLANFLAVTVTGITPADIADAPFELGYAFADATGAITAEPELGTDFYFVPRTGETEGLDNFPPGCWVDDAEDPTSEQPLWALRKIKATDAWDLPPRPGGKARGEGVLVFQPDTGVADHSELEAGMLGTEFAFDFVAHKNGAVDPMNYSGNPGHGTGTASVVASRTSGIMSGTAPLATLVPLRAVTSVIVLDHGRVAAAVEYARKKGANVITMSLGGAWSSALRAAIGNAISAGIIVLAAAGNCVRVVVWPARYEEVIAVAGYNISDKPWIGSCRGEAVDIVAPAEFVPRANRSPANGGGPADVRGGQGTSFAVALTAGVAALWVAHHGIAAIKAALRPGETVQDRFAALLKATAWRPPGEWPTDEFGAGIVNAKALLEHGLEPPGETELVLADTDSLRSLHTALAEAAPASLEAATDVTAGPPSSRRYAAELSHLVLAKQRRRTQGDTLETLRTDPPPSDTLKQALAQAGRADLLEFLKLNQGAHWSGGATMPDLEMSSGANKVTAARYKRMLAGRAAAGGAEGPFESAAASPDLSDKAIADRIDTSRSELSRIVRDHLGDKPELHDIAERIAQAGRAALGAIAEQDDDAPIDTDVLASLEVIVRTDGSRPSFMVRNGEPDHTTSPIGNWKTALDDSAALLREALQCVGRINDPSGAPGIPGHRVLDRQQRGADKSPRIAGDCEGADRQELEAQTGHRCRLRARISRPRVDRAPQSDGSSVRRRKSDRADVDRPRQTRLGPARAGTGRATFDDAVVRHFADWGQPETGVFICGYPGNPGFAEAPSLLEQLFRSTFGCKRIAPGLVTTSASNLAASPRHWTLGHDCTTLGGNSGSAVLVIGREKVAAGLHYGGRRTDPRENWCHLLGPTLDEPDFATGTPLRDVLEAQGVRLVDRLQDTQ